MNISRWKEKGSKYIVIALVGLLILVISMPTEEGSVLQKEENVTQTQNDLELRLEQVLSAMEGVGSVEVMIMTSGGEETVFGTQSSAQNVCGVVVVAEGAGNATVNGRISAAIKALFGIDVHKISIVKMRAKEG